MLEKIDYHLGRLYLNMRKVIGDTGDFIQGFKKMILKEMNAVITLMFGMGVKLCLLFIALDAVLILLDKEYNKISIVSKCLALIGILVFKYNLVLRVKQLATKNNPENTEQ